MKKKILYSFLTILFILIITLVIQGNVFAASATISASPKTINPGETSSITAQITSAATWELDVSASGGNLSKNDNRVDTTSSGNNESKTIEIATFSATTPGEYTITLSGNVYDGADLTNPVTAGDSVTITVSAPAPTPTPTPDPEPTPQPQPEPQPEPKFDVTFTEASGTVYTTVNSLNFRSTSTGDVIGSIENAGTALEVTGKADGKTRVKYNGTEGYVSSDYVTSEKPEEKTEEKSNNANLKSLSIENVTITPEFKADVTSYKVEVGKDIKELNVKAEAEDEKAKIDIQGNKDLKDGENKIAVSVSAEDGTIKIYEITVTKKDAVVLGLKSLSIKDTDMANKFKTDKYNYEVNVNDVDKLDIQAVATIDTAKIEILGNENLQDGDNLITIMVKSEDGKQTVTYQIKVKKNVEVAEDVATNNTNKLDSRVYLYGGICILALIILIALIVYLIKNKSKNNDEFEDDLNNLYDYDKENKKDSFKNEFSNDFDEVEDEPLDIDEETKKPKRGRGKHF